VAKFLRHEQEIQSGLILETYFDSDSRHEDSTTVMWAVTVVQVEVKFMFCQDHSTIRIVMMSILSLEVHID
jgi:hypothetical protein